MKAGEGQTEDRPMLRSFEAADFPILERRNPNMTPREIEEMLAASNAKRHKGKYFEMFAVTAKDEIVGSVNIFQHTGEVISCGPEIYPEFRRRGYASWAVARALRRAEALGYRIAVAQVRTDNAASIALHHRLGFEIDHEYVNAKGHKVFFFIKALGPDLAGRTLT